MEVGERYGGGGGRLGGGKPGLVWSGAGRGGWWEVGWVGGEGLSNYGAITTQNIFFFIHVVAIKHLLLS